MRKVGTGEQVVGKVRWLGLEGERLLQDKREWLESESVRWLGQVENSEWFGKAGMWQEGEPERQNVTNKDHGSGFWMLLPINYHLLYIIANCFPKLQYVWIGNLTYVHTYGKNPYLGSTSNNDKNGCVILLFSLVIFISFIPLNHWL